LDAQYRAFFGTLSLEYEVDELECKLKLLNSPIVFSHNDLLASNIIYDKNQDSVLFIDYEYSSYNYRGFDIGNHFCEFAGFECNWSRYPSRKLQWKWLRNYLSSFLHTDIISDDEITKLYIEVNQFSLAAHLYWGIWALVQAHYSDIKFDYMNLAMQRISRYLVTKRIVYM
jgi:ethanolamine kinase